MPFDGGLNPIWSSAIRSSFTGAVIRIGVKFRMVSVKEAIQQITLEAVAFSVLVSSSASHAG